MKRYLRLAAWGIAAASLGGCATYQDTAELARRQEDWRLLREEVDRGNGRLESLEMEYRRLAGLADAAQGEARGVQDDRRAAQIRLDELDRRLAALEAARSRDRQEIVDQLSAKMAEILAASAPRAAGRKGAAAQTGYEHVVKDGETLSAIAAAYKVRVNAIIEANALQNPNVLLKGQKLFIPQP